MESHICLCTNTATAVAAEEDAVEAEVGAVVEEDFDGRERCEREEAAAAIYASLSLSYGNSPGIYIELFPNHKASEVPRRVHPPPAPGKRRVPGTSLGSRREQADKCR